MRRSARTSEEIVEPARIEALETIRCLLFERAQNRYVFFDCSADRLWVTAAGHRLNVRGKQNRQRQRRHGKSYAVQATDDFVRQ
jgi:hypothetical protein